MLTSKVALDTPGVLVSWDADTKSVIVSWKGVYVSGPEYRDILTKALDLVEEKRVKRLVVDTRRMPVWSQEDQEWVQREWMPRSVKVGLRYTAVVMPTSALSRLSARHILNDSSHIGRERAYFETIEEAKQWIKSVPD